SGRSLLNQVTAFARNPQTGAEETLPPTKFSWGKRDPNKTAGFAAAANWSGGPQLSQSHTAADTVNHKIYSTFFAFMDFENHGYTDILEKQKRPLNAIINDTD